MNPPLSAAAEHQHTLALVASLARIETQMDQVLRRLDVGAEKMSALDQRIDQIEREIERDRGRREILLFLIGGIGAVLGALLPKLLSLLPGLP